MASKTPIKKLGLGILAGSILAQGIAAVLTGGASLGASAIIGGIGGAALGIWGNLISGEIADEQKSLPAAVDALYHNGNLERLIVRTIAACIRSLIEENPTNEPYLYKELAEQFEAAIAKDERHDFIHSLPQFTPSDAPDVIARFIDKKHTTPIATPGEWRAFLDQLIGPTDYHTISGIRDTAAARIATDFAHILYEQVLHANAHDQAAYAAIAIRFQSALLEHAKSAPADTAQLILPSILSLIEGQTHILKLLEQNRPVADKIPDLTALTDAFTAQVQQLQTNDHANAGRYDKIADQLRDVKDTLHRIEKNSLAAKPPTTDESYSDDQLNRWRHDFSAQALAEYRGTKHKPVPTALPNPASKLIGRNKELTELLALTAAAPHISITAAGGIGKTALAIGLIAALPQKPARTYFHDFYRSQSLSSFIGNILGQAGIASDKSEHLPALCKLALSQPKTLLYIEGGEKIGRYSIVSFDPEAVVEERNGETTFASPGVITPGQFGPIKRQSKPRR